MAANVESMFWTGRTAPWHGLGIGVENAPDSKEALELAGLNWRVEQKPIYTSSGTLIAGYKANVRNTDQSVLGVVSNRYRIITTESKNLVKSGFWDFLFFVWFYFLKYRIN